MDFITSAKKKQVSDSSRAAGHTSILDIGTLLSQTNVPNEQYQNFRSKKIKYNTMVKTYRDGSQQIIFATKQIFRAPGWESAGVSRIKLAEEVEELAMETVEKSIWQLEREEEDEAKRHEDSVRRSMRRARVQVRDYCLSTDMKYFCTFTLDQEKINRYDIKAITQKLNQWLNHQVQRKGLSYVMVPELHKDGAVHFHGLLTDALKAEDSGTIIPKGQDRPRKPRTELQRSHWLRDGGRVVYNLPGWPYGFTTALQLEGNYEKAVNYVCKYISKSLRDENMVPCKVGGRWYYSGGKLGVPGREYTDRDPDAQIAGFGEAAHKVALDKQLPGVEVYVVWITPDGVPK